MANLPTVTRRKTKQMESFSKRRKRGMTHCTSQVPTNKKRFPPSRSSEQRVWFKMATQDALDLTSTYRHTKSRGMYGIHSERNPETRWVTPMHQVEKKSTSKLVTTVSGKEVWAYIWNTLGSETQRTHSLTAWLC